MNWWANVRRLFRASSATSFKTHFARSSGKRIGRSARIRPMPIGRASCSPTRSAWRRICTASARTFVPSFAWSSDAAGMFGPLSGSRSSRTLSSS
jgi:hypothetical protein